jgi:hypothetical protein
MFLRISYLLFPREDVLIEVVLDLLIGNIDTKLLERILGKILKAENVQKTDCQRLFAANENKISI